MRAIDATRKPIVTIEASAWDDLPRACTVT